MRHRANRCVHGWLNLILVLPVASAQERAAPFPLPSPTNKAATLTFGEVREGVRRHYKELWAIEVEYEQVTKGAETRRVKFHFAMKGESRLRHQTPEDGERYGMAYDGNADVYQLYEADSKLAIIDKKKQYSFVDRDAYVDALGIPLSDSDRANTAWLPDMMPYALDVRRLDWEVQPTLEVVDGAECHVLVSPGRQRIWIDPQIGYAIRFREMYQPAKDRPEAKSPLLARYFFRDFERTEAGVWLPKKNEIVGYIPTTSPRSTWDQIRFHTVHTVTRVAAGHQVKDSVFRFKFEPGTSVTDNVSDRFYRIGDSGEELDVLVGLGREELAESRWGFRIWLLLSNVVIVVALALWLGVRYFRRRPETRAEGRVRDRL